MVKPNGYREHPRGFLRRVFCWLFHHDHLVHMSRKQREIPIRNQMGTEVATISRRLEYYHCWRCGMRWKSKPWSWLYHL